jgi:hypothetical protein
MGRRLQVLTPDPTTAPWVRWIFAERSRGRALASIARELNDRGVPCPSGSDPGRNPHRPGARWMVTAVAAILENPRYTGRQPVGRRALMTARADVEHRSGLPQRPYDLADGVALLASVEVRADPDLVSEGLAVLGHRDPAEVVRLRATARRCGRRKSLSPSTTASLM